MKKRHLTVMPGVLLALLLIGLFIGCSGSETTDDPVVVAATGVTINDGAESVEVTIGTPLTLTASVVPEGASQVVGWIITSDAIPAPATIGALTGTVEGTEVGVSTATVTAVGDGTTLIQDSITVNVVASQ